MNHKTLPISLLLIGLLSQSCSILQDIKVEDDIVNSSKRVKAEFYYRFSKEWDSPLILLNQKIVKEVKQDSTEHYRVYDFIKLKSNSFKLDNNIYIIVDNQPFPIEVEYIESKMIPKIEEKRKEILTSDSTKVSVVIGYEENQTWNYRIVYSIDNAIINKIKSAKNVMLRYYAGPDMITIKLDYSDLNTLKKMIAIN
ncbi:MAG: hypothetical protein AB7S48_15780 [Bacteroidales bacterium]